MKDSIKNFSLIVTAMVAVSNLATTTSVLAAQKPDMPAVSTKSYPNKVPGKLHFPTKFTTPKTLPTKYDPRAVLPAVTNQGSSDLCWDYTANNIMMNAKRQLLGITTEYSPNYYNYLLGADSFAGGENNPFVSGYRQLNMGGYVQEGFEAALLGHNPVTESSFPTTDANGKTTAEFVTTPIEKSFFDQLQNDNSWQVKDIVIPRMVDTTNPEAVNQHINQIKDAVVHHGGASYNYNAYLSLPDYLEFEHPVYNLATSALYQPQDYKLETSEIKVVSGNMAGQTVSVNPKASNHATTIVGYDDSYAKENFNAEMQPTNDGAFLVRNSWGTARDDQGYFWVSYEDYSIYGTRSGTSLNITKPTHENYHSNATTSGAASSFAIDPRYNFGQLIVTNSFTPTKAETMDAVTIQGVDKADEYSLYLYHGDLNPENGDDLTVSDILANATELKIGTTNEQGMFKVKVPLTKLKANEPFTLVQISEEKTHTQPGTIEVSEEPVYNETQIAGNSAVAYSAVGSDNVRWHNLQSSDAQSNYLNYYSIK